MCPPSHAFVVGYIQSRDMSTHKVSKKELRNTVTRRDIQKSSKAEYVAKNGDDLPTVG